MGTKCGGAGRGQSSRSAGWGGAAQSEGAAGSGNPIPVQPWAAGSVHRIHSIKHRFFSSVSIVTSHMQTPPPRGWGHTHRLAPCPEAPRPPPQPLGGDDVWQGPGPGCNYKRGAQGCRRTEVSHSVDRALIYRQALCSLWLHLEDASLMSLHPDSISKASRSADRTTSSSPSPASNSVPRPANPGPLPRGCLPVLPCSGGSSVGEAPLVLPSSPGRPGGRITPRAGFPQQRSLFGALT